MATFAHKGLMEAIDELKLEGDRIERNGDAALSAAADVAVSALQKTVPVRHGDLKASIGYANIKKDGDGKYVDVLPQGMKKQTGKSQRFATIGFVLEYGRSNMPAQPWMEPAMEREAGAIYDALESELMKD